MRQRDPLTIEEARELDALERALAGDPVDYDLREFEELVSDIRATAPEMTPGFAARLEHQVQEGFPESQEQPALRKRRRLLVLLPAAGTVAAMLIALVVVLGQGTGDDRDVRQRPTAVQQDHADTRGTARRPRRAARRDRAAADGRLHARSPRVGRQAPAPSASGRPTGLPRARAGRRGARAAPSRRAGRPAGRSRRRASARSSAAPTSC